MSAERAVIRLELELSAMQGLEDLSERRGTTQITVTSRLVRWLASQDDVVQASVLGLLSKETLGDLSQALLQRLAAASSASSRVPQPVQSGKASRSKRVAT